MLYHSNRHSRMQVISKLIINTPEQPQWRHFGVIIVNFIAHCSGVSNVGFSGPVFPLQLIQT